MASITQEILLELNIKGTGQVAKGLDKIAKKQEYNADVNMRNAKINESFANSILKANLKLREMGGSLDKVNLTQKQYNRALMGNPTLLTKVLNETNKYTKSLKLHGDALKEDAIRNEKKRIDMLKIHSKAITENIALDKRNKQAIKSVRQQLVLLNTEYKRKHKINISEIANKRLLRKVYGGNTFALKKLRQELNLYREEQSKSQKEGLFTFRNNRLLGGSFATLRSRVLIASFGITMFTKTIGRFTKAAGNAEEVNSKFNTVFGQSAKRAEEFAQSIEQRALTQLKDFLSTLQDTLVPLGFARDFAAELSQSMVQLALDVASFNNKMDADVVRDFQSALVGNHETVKKYGIILNKNRVELEAYNLGLEDSEGNINEQAKAFARLSIITKSSQDAQGDLIKTQDEFNNQMKALAATSQKSMELIGDAIKPVATQLLKLANVALSPVAVTVYAIALSALTVKMINFSKVVGLTRTAFELFNTTLLKSPIGRIVLGISALAGTLVYLTFTNKKAEQSTRDYNDELAKQAAILKEFNKKSLEERLEGEKAALKETEALMTVKNQQVADSVDLSKDEHMSYVLQLKDLAAQKEAQEANIKNLKTEIEIRDKIKTRDRAKAVEELTNSYKNQLTVLQATTEEEKLLAQAAVNLKVDIEELPDSLRDAIKAFVEFKDSTENIKTGLEVWGLYNSALGSTISAFEQLGQVEIDEARKRELRNAEGIKNENRRRAEIERINKKYDDKQRERNSNMKKWKQISALSNTFLSITQTIADETIKPSFLKIPLAAAIAAQGFAAQKQIQAQQFAKGGDFITSGAENIVVGEAGRERVTITPLDRPESRALGSMGGVTVNFTGNILTQDFIEDEAIPMIKEAVRRGADLGVA